MQKKQLGSTDIQVSKLCLGTMVWWAQNTEMEAHEQMDYAVAHGINFLDTAELYAVPPRPETQWLTEKYVGTWMQERKNRSDIILATKVTGSMKNNWGVSHVRNGEWVTPSGIITAVEWSLERLQTDYIDLYQLHWPQRKVQMWGKMNYDESMIEEKKVQGIKTGFYIYHLVFSAESLKEAIKKVFHAHPNSTLLEIVEVMKDKNENYYILETVLPKTNHLISKPITKSSYERTNIDTWTKIKGLVLYFWGSNHSTRR